MSSNRLAIAAVFALASTSAFASPPLQINEAGCDNPATVFPERDMTVQSSGSAFPWAINEAGFDNPATVYPQMRNFARSSGSPFPWSVNEAGPYVAESAPSSNDNVIHTVRR
jgi:hypothetical protein